jgi:hypothetical protein
VGLARDILAALHRLRDAEAKDGKPPRAPTSPRVKPAKPGTPKDDRRT